MSPRGSAKILVVDDNELNLKLASAVLRADGFEVRTAIDAESALDSIRDERPALVFMDVQLPDVNGLELTRRLKADPRTSGIVVVALTAFAMEADRKAALAAGCDGFIAKPIDTRVLGPQTACYLGVEPMPTAA